MNHAGTHRISRRTVLRGVGGLAVAAVAEGLGPERTAAAAPSTFTSWSDGDGTIGPIS